MTDTNIYRDIAARTDGAFMLGVVGPVRTGKSTFIKRFMETLVIPRIDNTYMKERARDELPQSGSGRTIMTAEPKFVPENAVNIALGDGAELSVRLVDCVGYMVDGAAGQFEDGAERLVTTPWFDHVTADGTTCDIPREKYEAPEERAITELKSIGKPFVVLLNSAEPASETAIAIAEEITARYDVRCIRVNCMTLTEDDIAGIIRSVLEEFPLKSIGIFLPEWLEALPEDNELRNELFASIMDCSSGVCRIKDCRCAVDKLSQCECVNDVSIDRSDLGTGTVSVTVCLPRSLYYKTISEQTGIEINNDGDLISTLTEMSEVKRDYDKLRCALNDVRTKGYGVVMPDSSQMQLEEPQIVRQGGKYGVKLKANAPAIHMLMTNIETEVTPAIGGETASEDIINFLLQGFDGDVNRIWQSNIFGKSLYDIAEEGLTSKIESLPENAKQKLQQTLQRIINEGSGGLICILL